MLHLDQRAVHTAEKAVRKIIREATRSEDHVLPCSAMVAAFERTLGAETCSLVPWDHIFIRASERHRRATALHALAPFTRRAQDSTDVIVVDSDDERSDANISGEGRACEIRALVPVEQTTFAIDDALTTEDLRLVITTRENTIDELKSLVKRLHRNVRYWRNRARLMECRLVEASAYRGEALNVEREKKRNYRQTRLWESHSDATWEALRLVISVHRFCATFRSSR